MNHPKDPLIQATPDAPRELFARFSVAANGFPTDAAIGAAANMIINAIRQQCATRQDAERAMDELFGRTKSVLVDHYDMLGRKRGIFPYDQVISVPHFNFRRPN